MKYVSGFLLCVPVLLLLCSAVVQKSYAQAPLSPESEECIGCHSEIHPGLLASWNDSRHSKVTFARLENSIHTTNEMTRTGTQIMSEIWQKGLARGLPQNENIFDEEIERTWTSLWLFHANSIRFASAMAGGGDYGVFANGRYQMTENIFQLRGWLTRHQGAQDQANPQKSSN